MSNPYFTASGVPTQRSNGVSSVIRQEIANIALAFDKLPAFAGNLGKIVVIGAASLDPSAAITESGGNVTFGGNITAVNGTFTGNTTLGDGATDTLTVAGGLVRGANGNWTLPAAASGDTLNVAALGGNYAIVQSQAMAGGTAKWGVLNTSNTASSVAQFLLSVGGASAGDPIYQAIVSGVTTWTFGADNSQSDAFKWAAAGALSDTAAFAIETDGRIWGSNLHNNAGAVSGTTKQFAGLSGTYTPSSPGFAGVVTAVTPQQAQWIRVANVIVVSGGMTVTTSGAGFAAVDMPIPINSTFSGASNIGGVVSDSGGLGMVGGVVYVGSANIARMNFNCPGATTTGMSYVYVYLIL